MLYLTSKSAVKAASSTVFQKSLLCGVSLIAAGVLVGPRAAQAQSIHVVAGPPTTSTVNVSAGFSVYVDNGGVAGGAPGLIVGTGVSSPLVFVSLSGAINSDYTTAQSAGVVNDGTVTALIDNGTIIGNSGGVYNNGTIFGLTNTGTIYASSIAGIYNTNVIGSLANNGGTFLGARTGVYSTGTIASLSNSGTIAGPSHGIQNTGALGTLNNALGGVISSVSRSAIDNGGTIGQLTNSGTISSAKSTGVYNYGSITQLTNSGTIAGYGHDGVLNNGSIGTLINNSGGLIYGAKSGVGNSSTNSHGASIGTLTNSGTIYGGSSGIYNGYTSSITAISNTGTIIGSIHNGIMNNGTIGVLSTSGNIVGGKHGIQNNGAIASLVNLTDGSIYGSSSGIFNAAGTIGELTNSGMISGLFGVNNQSDIGSLTNLYGGTIYGSNAGIRNGTASSKNSSITSLSNNGVISGANSGVANLGTIGTLSNSGTISARNFNGVYNAGMISVLDNTVNATIYGAQNGVYNSNGTIGQLTNAGLILDSTLTDSALRNYGGTIGTLTNLGTGTISGVSYGIHNEFNGSIVALTNTGTILGQSFAGIYNQNASIAALTNNAGGTISGGFNGIANGSYRSSSIWYGSIGTLTNSGLIADSNPYYEAILNYGSIGALNNLAGGSIIGGSYGVYNEYGSIGALTNSGTIVGTHYAGIYNYDGTIGVLTNSSIISGREYGVGNEYTSAIIGTLTNNAGGVIQGGYTGAYNYGSITSLTNSGTISGSTLDGVFNAGSITGLTNNAGGTIIGGEYGAVNSLSYPYTGSIANLTNNGVIIGTNYTGVYNAYNAQIGQLTNNGTISGNAAGVGNLYGASIGTLANNAGGTIIGHYDGINNESGATIGLLTNSGSIIGVKDTGVYNNYGTIGTLTNSGVIAGVYGGVGNSFSGIILSLTNNAGGKITATNGAGIYNYGNIGQITNNGVISGGATGVRNNGTLGTLTNTGTISGHTGIYTNGTGTTIINMGTIASTNGGDAINLENNYNSLILDSGSVLVGTIYGGGYNNSITLEGMDSMSNTIADFGTGSTLTVAPGANWAAAGSWTIPNVYDNGTFEPGFITGGGVTSVPLTLNGNFTMGSGGTYVVLVTPATSSQFNVVGNGTTTGVATLAGTVKYVFAPGIYAAKTYTYLTASAPITTSFANVVYATVPNVNDLTTLYNVDPSVVLSILSPFSVSLPDQSIFSEQQQSLAQNTQNATGTILDKATEGGSNADPACNVQAPAQTQMAGSSMGGMTSSGSQIANTLASVFCGRGGWIEATGSLGHVDASNGAPAYNNNSAGFLAGVDTPVGTAGTRLGFAVGFDQTSLSDKAGGTGNLSTTRIALYGSQPLGSFTLAGVVGYGFASNKTTRSDGLGDSFGESNNVGIFNAGLQGSTHVELGAVDIAPAAGIKVASVNGTSFSENTSGLLGPLAVKGRLASYTSVLPYVSARASETFVTASNVVISPDLLLGFEYEAADRGRPTTITFSGGVPTNYATAYNKLDAGDALVSAGISASRNYWSLYATYTAHISGNWSDQTGEAGLRIKF